MASTAVQDPPQSATQAIFQARNLVDLPFEILAEILGLQTLDDLIRFRSGCRTFQSICDSALPWRNFFLNSIGEIIPEPFFLPKLLGECSAKDLENTIRRWEGDWSPIGNLEVTRRPFTLPNVKAEESALFFPNSFVLLPGGRFALYGHAVYYFDLSENWRSTTPVAPKVLVSAESFHFESRHANESIQTRIAVDYSPNEAMGSAHGAYHLLQINIAVVRSRPHRSGEMHGPWETHACVWRVRITSKSSEEDDISNHDLELELSERLLSITDSKLGFPRCCTLYGTALAVATDCVTVIVNAKRRRGVIFIVDWDDIPNSKDEILELEDVPKRSKNCAGSIPSFPHRCMGSI